MTRRSWSARVILAWFLEHKGTCHICGEKIQPGQAWEKEHVIPLAQGGDDALENLRPAHAVCHKKKTAYDASETARAKRREARHLGIRKSTSRPLPGSRASGWKRKFSGEVIRRDT